MSDVSQGTASESAALPERSGGYLVGMRFHPPAVTVLDHMPATFSCFVRRQPENEHDSNAIQVFIDERSFAQLEMKSTDSGPMQVEDTTKTKEVRDRVMQLVGESLRNSDLDPALADFPIFLGYIARDQAVSIAPMMDSMADPMQHQDWAAQAMSGTGRYVIVVELAQGPKS